MIEPPRWLAVVFYGAGAVIVVTGLVLALVYFL